MASRRQILADSYDIGKLTEDSRSPDGDGCIPASRSPAKRSEDADRHDAARIAVDGSLHPDGATIVCRVSEILARPAMLAQHQNHLQGDRHAALPVYAIPARVDNQVGRKTPYVDIHALHVAD